MGRIDSDDAVEAWNRRQEKENTQPREVIIPEEMEAYIKEHEKELLDVAVSTAAKPGFAVKYMGKTVPEGRECYFCQYCRRGRYIKGDWACAKFKPDEAPEGFSCFRKRENKPECSECAFWEGCGDYRCFCQGSWWEGERTSPENYCRFFAREILK